MRIMFSEATLKLLKVPDGKRDHQWFDETLPGFGIRKFTSGKAAFFIRYQFGKQQRKMTLGNYVPGTLTPMRTQAAEILAQVRRGVDVKAAQKARDQLSEAPFGALVEQYLQARIKDLSPRWHKYVAVYLREGWAALHERQLRTLERGELVKHLDKIARTSGLVTADHCRNALSGLFGWAVDRGFAPANPLMRVKHYARGNARDRVLTPSELCAVWHSCGADDFGRIVRLLILTAQRKQEISELVWRELDLHDERQIELPRERTKNGRPHIIPLTAPAETILLSVKPREDREFLFGEGQRGFQGWSKAKGRLDIAARRLVAPQLTGKLERLTGDLSQPANRKDADEGARQLGYDSCDALCQTIMPHWTLHDLRRTAATLMNEFHLAEPHVVEAVLNHVSGPSQSGVAGVYNRATYKEQKRWALERLGDFVLAAASEFARDGSEAVEGFIRREKQKLREG